MSLTLPLAVRLSSAKADRHVTRDLHDLSFRSVVPGGYASASFTLSRPLGVQPDEIIEYGRVTIYDRRSGATLWEGRLEDPGRAAGDGGETWQITAVGPSAFAEDRTISLIYVDSGMGGWRVGNASIPSVDVQISEDSIKMGVATGTTHRAGFAGLAVYHNIAYTGQQLARVKVTFVPTFTSVNYESWLGTSIGTGSTTNLAQTAVLGTNSQTIARGGVTAIPAGHDTVRLRFVRMNTNITPVDDLITIQFYPVVRGLLVDENGTDIISGYVGETVLASTVVRDLLGRLLTRFDGPAAVIATTALEIDQLAYPDGASARRVLDDLMLLEPAYFWAAWEILPSGKHRFEWKAWPTTVRYDASVVDGFDSPAVTGEVYNAVTVRWLDGVGASRIVRATQTVDTLDDAGIVSEAFIDVSDEVGSAANAATIASTFLAEHQKPMNQGTLTITRPIMDLQLGRKVQPWEIVPGTLIRVRNVLPRIDTLNATDRDGVTVFRVVAVEFNAGTCAATLELDSYPRSVARAVAQLQKRNITRKR
jgi:hypothetical protein